MSKLKNSLKKNQLRRIFSGLEKRSSISEKSDNFDNILIEQGMKYIQMRLPVNKITPDFERKVKSMIEPHILNAKIREATERDFESILNIYNKSWLTSREPFSPLTIESLKNLYGYKDTKIFIVKLYGIDAGFMILDFEGTKNEYGIIAALAVLPRFQGKGLGKVMGIAAWEYFKHKSVKELRCEVYFNNKVSYNFIKSLGFEEYYSKIYKKEDFQPIEA